MLVSGEGGEGLEGVLSGELCRMWEARLQQVVQLADEGPDGAGSLPWALQHVLQQQSYAYYRQ